MVTKSNKEKVIDKLYDLYVIDTKRYILQPKWINKDKTNNNTKIENKKGIYVEKNCYKRLNDKPLFSKMMEAHTDGKYTIGVFGGQYYSKFICFDVDYRDNELCKWIVYKLCNTLREYGIYDYYISFSGSKGYHIEIFIDDLIDNSSARQFFNLITNKSDIIGYDGDVELRGCNFEQGVKIPLGIHQKNGKYCSYCLEENRLNPMSKNESEKYILKINKIQRQYILDILNREKDCEVDKKHIIQGERVINNHKKLKIYSPDFEDMESKSVDLLENGLKHIGSRHNSTMLIAKYFKWLGYSKEQMEKEIFEWLELQRGKYSSSEDEVRYDTNLIIDYVIKNDCSIIPPPKNIEIAKSEFDAILKQCNQKNEKLLTYAMLIHSKRFSNKAGHFYMTYEQMVETTNLGEKTVRRIINKLIDQDIIISVERNRKVKNTYKKLPNIYKINLHIEQYENTIIYISDLYSIHEKDFTKCLDICYTKEELRKLLPRRQYQSLCC